MPRFLGPRAQQMLDTIPPFARDDPQIQASINVQAIEFGRVDNHLADVINMYWPQLASKYLYLWEAALGITVNPAGLTIPQRQARVLAFYQTQIDTTPSSQWVAMVSLLLGRTNWSWTRHTPGSGTGPPANTIWINLLLDSSSQKASDLANLVGKITPANTVVVINYTGGFLVQRSQIQNQPL